MKPSAPPLHGVVETALYCDDLATSTRFYGDVMGLPRMQGDGQRFEAFDAGAQRVLLLFKRGGTPDPVPVATGGEIPPHDGHGPLHVGFAIAEVDYARWRERLLHCGVNIEAETHWPRGGRSLYFRDPEGHLLELVTPGIWSNY